MIVNNSTTTFPKTKNRKKEEQDKNSKESTTNVPVNTAPEVPIFSTPWPFNLNYRSTGTNPKTDKDKISEDKESIKFISKREKSGSRDAKIRSLTYGNARS